MWVGVVALSALLAAAQVELEVSPLDVRPFRKNVVEVALANRDAEAVTGRVVFTVKPPVEVARESVAAVTVPAELRAVAPALASLPEEAQVIEGGPEVRVARRTHDGATVLLAVNRSDRENRARLSAPGAQGTWHALFEGPNPEGRDGDVAVALPPWGAVALTTHPTWRPVRHDYRAEAVGARPPRPLPTEEGNSIANPSFEADDDGDGAPDGWQVRYPFTVSSDSTGARSGERAVRIDASEAGFRPLAVLHHCPTQGGARYRLSGWMRSDTPTAKGRFYAEWVVDGRFYGRVLDWTAPPAEWTEFSVEFEATPDPAGNLYVVIQAEGPGRIWFDDLALRNTD